MSADFVQRRIDALMLEIEAEQGLKMIEPLRSLVIKAYKLGWIEGVASVLYDEPEVAMAKVRNTQI